jgi:hypothetical protein
MGRTISWIEDKCVECGGHGIVGRGFDMLPDTCHCCEGSGTVFISKGDRIALYPGGQFKGSWPGRYAELIEGEHGRI